MDLPRPCAGLLDDHRLHSIPRTARRAANSSEQRHFTVQFCGGIQRQQSVSAECDLVLFWIWRNGSSLRHSPLYGFRFNARSYRNSNLVWSRRIRFSSCRVCVKADSVSSYQLQSCDSSARFDGLVFSNVSLLGHRRRFCGHHKWPDYGTEPVSYTHLTLPTIYSV